MKRIENLPRIIQGGMGVGVSNWRLAKSVAQCGHLGVVSGTALDSVISRRLQKGDDGGHIRRALSHFPWPEVAERVLKKYFIDGGKTAGESFRLEPLPSLQMRNSQLDLLVVSNFVEVFLAKEGHDRPVGINFMEKIRLPLLPSLFGAMLADVDYILIGAGIPLSIPGILDGLADWKTVELKLDVENNVDRKEFNFRFDPAQYADDEQPVLNRPNFLAVVSSEIVAKSLIRRASGTVDGFIVETPEAGGHNAPPRRRANADPSEPAGFGPKDIPNLERIQALGKPFWIAGSQASSTKLNEALELGAAGIQVGSAFAFCEESGIEPRWKTEVVRQALRGELKVKTDFQASPTGYPFKVAQIKETIADKEHHQKRERICDLGYLRQAFTRGGTDLGFRCPGEPEEQFESKGGRKCDTAGKMCLCNGLLATIGLGQTRDGTSEDPIITAGEKFDFIHHLANESAPSYRAKQVIDYLEGQ